METAILAGGSSAISSVPLVLDPSSTRSRTGGPERHWSAAPSRIAQLYPPGMELFSQGSVVHEVYWLEEGLVKLVYVDEEGRERIFDLRVPRQLIGAAFVIVKLPSPVSAITVTRCRLQRMSAAEFARHIESDTELSWKVHQMQSEEVCAQFQRMAELTNGSLRVRLEHFLGQLVRALPSPRDRKIQLPLKRRELAQFLAVTPEHLSRVFKQLCEEGTIAFEKGWLVIRDVQRLANASGEPEARVAALAADRLYT